MTVLELMERAGIRDTNLAISWIKDAIHYIESTQEENLKVKKSGIIKGQRDYDLPADLISINSISVLDTEDDSKYKKIRRISGEHYITEDKNP